MLQIQNLLLSIEAAFVSRHALPLMPYLYIRGIHLGLHFDADWEGNGVEVGQHSYAAAGVHMGKVNRGQVEAFFGQRAQVFAFGMHSCANRLGPLADHNGGTVASHVDPKDWGNHLSVSADSITFLFKDGQRSEINPKSVTSLSYGQEAHRRVGTMIALAILVAPVALFGLFHKTRLHFIGIQYRTPDGQNAGLLLQGDKDNYRAILVALQSVSGVAVSVSDMWMTSSWGIHLPH